MPVAMDARASEARVQISTIMDEGAFGWLDKLLIAVWRGASVESADLFYEEMRRGIARHERGLGHLAVIEPKTPLPPPDARARIAEVFNEYPDATAAVSVVFEGTGFFAAAVGSVATGIMFLSGRRTPFKVATNLGEAALFLSRHIRGVDGPMSARACSTAVEVLRRRLHGTPSMVPNALG